MFLFPLTRFEIFTQWFGFENVIDKMERVPTAPNNDKYLVSETVKDAILNENSAVIVTKHRYHHFLGAPFQPNKDFLRKCRVSEQTIGQVQKSLTGFEYQLYHLDIVKEIFYDNMIHMNS